MVVTRANTFKTSVPSIVLSRRFSKRGPRTSTFGLTWEPVGDADSQAPLRGTQKRFRRALQSEPFSKQLSHSRPLTACGEDVVRARLQILQLQLREGR